ncbi:hypothetical protein CAY62_18805 [Photobacterium damselae subsp. damselae]|nr:hypothetical protein CAY62_18805 [Photobacterium damselae subsp. damselae]
MLFSKKENKLKFHQDSLIADIQCVVEQRYSKYDVKLIKKVNSDGFIELQFNVGSKELLTMSLNKN